MTSSTVPSLAHDDARPTATVGILAGNGVYPALLHSRLKARGLQVVVAGIEGQTAATLKKEADLYRGFPLGAIKRTARFFTRHDADKIFFAGGVRRKGALRYARPDRFAIALAARTVTRGDDNLLRHLADAFSELGVEVIDPSPYIGDLFAPAGRLAGPATGQEVDRSLAVACRAAMRIGREDRGQAAIAKGDRVWGVEDKGGTDALIARCDVPHGVLAKAVKPGQDCRFDMPAIGPKTVALAHRHGLRAIGVQADGVLLLEKNRIYEACDRHCISLFGFLVSHPAENGFIGDLTVVEQCGRV